ncbi:type VII secretion-associated serine protease mycosin [Couchioplanes caeruleus]|uniref:type VII secretion-associated serine protease mycosin n=1 Tax=Couchioplanes caeruleus TaxID=56438 RepID=UPI00201C7933|nr:type VII secretion-associated serine protease mycosin [Couchioplanes caeruleus]UQU65612.1 type VII secretion-associated serine protease mycosin [Couchioplanes caeruleus]
MAASFGIVAPATPANADFIRDRQWHLKSLDIATAHRISTGEGVTVAVIDSGVSRHPDLAGSILAGTDFVKKGGNGQIDKTGHGTGMAGLIAAHGRSGVGALGIAPDAKILPIRVLDTEEPRNAELGPAIRYAVAHGAQVINISVGGGLNAATMTAVQAAADADVVVVASAGNKPQNVGVTAPAVLDSIAAVGAVNRKGRKADISVTGPALDLMAPGEDIESTSNRGQYRTGTGTSDSAAIVSGAAALLRSKYPDMTAEEVVERLEQTATDKGAPGVDPEYGHGIVNIVAALSDDTTHASASPSATPPTSTPTTPAEAAPANPEAKSNATPLIAVGAIALAALALGGVLRLRRRRSTSSSG